MVLVPLMGGQAEVTIRLLVVAVMGEFQSDRVLASFCRLVPLASSYLIVCMAYKGSPNLRRGQLRVHSPPKA